ncbi:MAG: hypothetical protein M3Q95_04600 [Bacteroidota bacterium]|nr:hypothetical protein [Bacteroidota bacterium]
MNHFLLIGAAFLVFTGCGQSARNSDPEKGIFFSDFESLYYWNESGNLVNNRGRDGSGCIKVDQDHEYTPTFKVRVSDIKIKNPRRLTVNGWFKVDDLKATAKLVTCVDNNGEIIGWNASSSEELARKTGVWTKIESSTNIPAGLPGDAKLVVYGLRTGTGEVLFDDLEIKITE